MVEVHQSNASSVDADARRLALEAIATLVYVKKTAAEQVLRRADVPEDLIRRFLTERDPATGEKRSKRDAGAMVLDELLRRGEIDAVVRKIVDIAASWTSFHLAQNEYQARAVAQKAQDLRSLLADAHERATAEAEARRAAEREARRKEDADILTRQSALLLAQFDQAAASREYQQRGYLLEDLLNRTFDLHGMVVHKAFRRNGGGEQIDGAFELDGWHYIVECRWRERLPDIRQLDGLIGQVARSGRQTMGLFVSIEGWSENVVPLLKQNPNKVIILMEGFDFRSVLDRRIGLRELLKAKITALNIEAEPYLPASKMF
ncbi:MAG TPA: hypothetical protein VF418_12450 [Sphingomonadaceae bacterium]